MTDSYFHRTNEVKVVTSSPAEPVYYLYTFPEGVDTVVIMATSDDTKCMTLSIQNVKVMSFRENFFVD